MTLRFTFPDNGGNLGPLQLDVGFKPPNGVGLAIDGGGFAGGGYLFLDPGRGEYAGALELDSKGSFTSRPSASSIPSCPTGAAASRS